MDKISYLKTKLLSDNCSSIGADWHQSVQKQLHHIPECSFCTRDLERIKTILNDGIIINPYDIDCTESCLWWEWFSNKRDAAAKKHGYRCDIVRNKDTFYAAKFWLVKN